MSWIDLGNPAPKPEPVRYTPIIWSVNKVKRLSTPNRCSSSLFIDVIASRRTRRSFGKVTSDELSLFLWLSAHCQERGNAELGFPLERQPAASAGAIHPIHTLVSSYEENVLWRYITSDHTLASVQISEADLRSVKKSVEEIVQPDQGILLLFVAEPGKTFAKYDDGCSLVWRDAGVLQGHMSLVAEALSLNFCLLGTTGDPWVNQLDRQGRLVGIGMALLGS